ncbi:shikimate dehydrogenase [Bradyrhizobium sp. LHD-71]|uniref:shikimate dehydrogenase n=1 Tax=Bradyrhizobium sp. LHD-71 TaxID=3072141 RepID=UPI00280FFEF8|nr:shikimate dehydrogenase [Bradyrhizobium sp. LHD-71]MDQ8729276.1 shikimate dehydrogenase [Bradyrhizobium sp. LHD-71]
MDPSVQRSVLVGLVGAGIQASRTPALHEREGAAQGLHYMYRLIDLDTPGLSGAGLADILSAADRFGFAGLNITHPCKQTALSHLDELSAEAAMLAAVNTVVFKDGRRMGHNTDRSGFERSFTRNLPDVRRRCVALFGAGGAGAAVACALLRLGVDELLIVDTEQSRAATVAATMRGEFGPRVRAEADAAQAMRQADGVVNATPVGMARYPGMAVETGWLRTDMWVADIVYFPLETELLRQARLQGCRTMDGGDMAVFQAADAFRLFTGLEPDTGRMLRHFRSM